MKTDFKVLYRKYRPTSFDEVVGQEYTIKMLKNAVINNKISHAYIFTGPRGTGKTSTAKIFAKTINCENANNGVPCGHCSSCLNSNNNADIIEIDAASNNGVDEIREIINNVKIAPSFSKYKVYIIDEVHMLSQSAFNALLLTLEEPPSHVVFILATTNIESVPITILSRCQRYDFFKLSINEITSHLAKIAEIEKIAIDSEALNEIAYLSEGGLRDALSILNQLSTSNSNITLETVIENYGSVSNLIIENVVNTFLANDINKLENIFSELKRKSLDYKIFIKKIIDLLYVKALNYKKNKNSLLFEKIKKMIFELNDVLNKININVDPFILISIILTQYMDNIVIEDNKNDNNTPYENDIVIKHSNNNDNNDEKMDSDYLNQHKLVRINNCFVNANKENLNTLKITWKDFNANISSNNDINYLIVDSKVVAASDEYAIIAMPQESMAELFNLNYEKIEKYFKEITSLDYKFISLSIDEWTKVKNNYIINLKNKYIYERMEEPSLKKENNIPDSIPNKENDKYFEVFSNEKLEIK